MPDIDADAFGQWFFETRGYYPNTEDHGRFFEVWQAAWRIAQEQQKQRDAEIADYFGDTTVIRDAILAQLEVPR